jgi:hypothetical protein
MSFFARLALTPGPKPGCSPICLLASSMRSILYASCAASRSTKAELRLGTYSA